MRVTWPMDLSKSKSSLHQLLRNHDWPWRTGDFFFFCSILSFTWRLDTVLISLPVLTQLISCDYFATRLDISRHFDVLSFVYFKCNLFCTIASYVWYFSADSLRQMSATQLEQFAEWQVYFSNPRLCLLPVTLLI